MEAAVVGLTNALGQMFNCWKEQTPLVFYSYRTEESLPAGRDGFEELPGQEQLTEPMTKLTWSARGAGQIAETVRQAFRVAWTPPYGPTYMNWHSDFTEQRVTADFAHAASQRSRSLVERLTDTARRGRNRSERNGGEHRAPRVPPRRDPPDQSVASRARRGCALLSTDYAAETFSAFGCMSIQDVPNRSVAQVHVRKAAFLRGRDHRQDVERPQ
jgi:hypothetical protein